MIFAQYRYKNFHNQNTDKHPIQPYCWDNWVEMVNNNQKYCSKMNAVKWVKLYFWIMMGRVRKVELPSFHRYWRLQVNKQYKVDIKSLIVKYVTCKKNPSQIKYLFNKTTSLKDIEQKILKMKNEIKKL